MANCKKMHRVRFRLVWVLFYMLIKVREMCLIAILLDFIAFSSFEAYDMVLDQFPYSFFSVI